ncbi:hypothetical protein F2Q69_00048091 [Brassica cretica]|uniref:Uncharacterized protein n=1 Tax=Brassica cretica TaxID=69181 RepID=A0A8S9PTH7_BRACR|nr:hypothetical protein F2Q69_00048091 [Brassica cretica]
MSLRGSGRRRQRSHSVALLVWLRGRDQMAIDMFCGKRHEEDSSNKGLQLLLSIKKADLDTKERLGKMKLLDSLIAKRGALASLVSFKRVALASLVCCCVVVLTQECHGSRRVSVH